MSGPTVDEWAHLEEMLEADVEPRHKRDWPAWAPVWEELIFSDLSDRAVRLYAALARYSGKAGAWPSRRLLSARLNCSVASVDRAVQELLDAGWVTVTGRVRPSDGAQTSNLFRLHQSPRVQHPLLTSEDPPSSPTRPQERQPDERHPPTPHQPDEKFEPTEVGLEALAALKRR